MDVIKRRLDAKKLRLANGLMIFCLNNKIDNEFVLKFIFIIYQLLVRNSYVLEHKQSRHHYIPRFLLKEFKIPNSGQIFQNTYLQKHKRVSIEKEAACVDNLYSIKDKNTKSQSDFLENQIFAFSLEKFASRIIHQIILTENIELTNLESSILTSFVAFQHVRTPRFLYFIRSVLEYLHLERKVPITEMVKYDFYEKTFFSNKYMITPKMMANFGKNNKLKMSGADDLILRLAIQIGNHLSVIIYKKELRLLIAKEPAFFYLSDNPSEIFNTKKARSISPFMWEIEQNPLIFMPITHKLCLYFLEGKDTSPPQVVGSIIEDALPKSIYEFTFSDRQNNRLVEAFDS